MKRDALSIVIDERQDMMDEYTSRSIYSVVELPESINLHDLSITIQEHAVGQDTENLSKLHFTSMNYAQRLHFVQLLSKLPITVKIYTYYNYRENNSIAKKQNLVKAIKATQYKHRNKELAFYVESADEYKGLIISSSLTSDHFLSLLPDCYCYLFATRLNRPINSPKTNAINNLMYPTVSHQIRLQTYQFGDLKFEDSKNNKL